MFTKLLVGVDGTPSGRDAIALASQLAGPAATLTFVHVHPGRLRPTHAVSPSLVREEQEAAQALLERERAAAGSRAALVAVEAFSPGRALHERAEQERADLIVVGSCSRGALGRTMLGDDARAALNGSPCAVAIAAAGFAEHPSGLANIGVAYNDSSESRAALALARRLAEPTSARLQAMEVITLPTYAYTGLIPAMVGDSIELSVQEADARLQQLDGVEGHAVYGLAGEELARFGDGLDLLVVGSRGYGPVKRLVLGSTTEYLERHAHCSLLVLPRPVSEASYTPSDVGEPTAMAAKAR